MLRIEDTDQNRYVPGAEQYIIDALNWCGIPYDEGVDKEGDCGPYRQSERKNIYRQYADQLFASGMPIMPSTLPKNWIFTVKTTKKKAKPLFIIITIACD